MKHLIVLLTFLTTFNAFAQMQNQDFDPSQVTFDFMSVDGSYWYDCTHVKGTVPHAWKVTCKDYEFSLHMFMYEYPRADETMYEFHYWADEVHVLKESHTQSTWITVDKQAKAKKIIAYLGFLSDSAQLRMEVHLDQKKVR